MFLYEEDQSGFHDFFNEFLKKFLDTQLIDLLPTIQYASTYFKLFDYIDN